MIGIIKSKTLK